LKKRPPAWPQYTTIPRQVESTSGDSRPQRSLSLCHSVLESIADMTESSTPPRRRWMGFRLRTLLILVAVIVIPLAWVA
jgi:hypothetical protein